MPSCDALYPYDGESIEVIKGSGQTARLIGSYDKLGNKLVR